MENKEAVEMMSRCAAEITQLRAEIDRLSPRAAAYDSISDILRLLPKPSQGYGEDLLWNLRKRIKELQPGPEVSRAAAAV